MDPNDEKREMKRLKEYMTALGYVADSEYGIPKQCPCGSSIIDEVRSKEEYDTQPGNRFFTCKNFEDDGFHYRQPWDLGVQEEIERLTIRAEEAENGIRVVPYLQQQIESLKATVANLTGKIDTLSAQVSLLENLRYSD